MHFKCSSKVQSNAHQTHIKRISNEFQMHGPNIYITPTFIYAPNPSINNATLPYIHNDDNMFITLANT